MKQSLLLPMIFVLSFASHSETKAETIPNCQTTFDIFPNHDLVNVYSRGELPKHRLDLNRLNGLLAPEHRFSVDQLNRAAYNLVYREVDEIVQLRQMVGFPGEKDGWFSRLNGNNGEWEIPVYNWLKTLVERPFPTREKLSEPRSYRDRVKTPLNMIDQHRYKLAKAKGEAIEKEIGQSIYGSPESMQIRLDWAARSDDAFDTFMNQVEGFRGTPPSFPISKWYNLLEAFAGGISRMGLQDERISSTHLLLTLIKHPEYHDEVRFYLSKATEMADKKARLSWFEGAYTIIRRIRGMSTGEKTFMDTVHNVIAKHILESFSFANAHARGYGTGYIGPALHYSINKSLVRDPLFQKGYEEYGKITESMGSQNFRLQYLGTMHFQAYSFLFGKQMGKEPSHYADYVFAAEISFPSQKPRHFAIAVQPKLRGNARFDLSDFSPENLLDIELREIREVSRPARLSDAVSTFPYDLEEPMLKMVPSSIQGKSPFKHAFNSLLVTHVPLNAQRQVERSMNEWKQDIMVDFATALFKGKSMAGEESIRFKLFQGNRQVDPTEFELPLLSRTTGQEVFEKAYSQGVQNVKIRLTRNLLTGKYTIEVQNTLKLVGLSSGSWSAELSP